MYRGCSSLQVDSWIIEEKEKKKREEENIEKNTQEFEIIAILLS